MSYIKRIINRRPFLDKSSSQIFANIVITTVSRCLYVSMYMCVLSFNINVCSQVAKILKNQLYGIEHFQSSGISSLLLLFDLDLHVQG